MSWLIMQTTWLPYGQRAAGRWESGRLALDSPPPILDSPPPHLPKSLIPPSTILFSSPHIRSEIVLKNGLPSSRLKSISLGVIFLYFSQKPLSFPKTHLSSNGRPLSVKTSASSKDPFYPVSWIEEEPPLVEVYTPSPPPSSR